MGRELKFRAWHKQNKIMRWFDLMWGNFYQGDGWIGMLPIGEKRGYGNKDHRIQVDPYDCEILQYTGLKDKDNKEIYHGDILRCPSEFADNGLEIVEIFWSYTDAAWWGRSAESEDELVSFPTNHCEVIGNIYETPSLLTEAINASK